MTTLTRIAMLFLGGMLSLGCARQYTERIARHDADRSPLTLAIAPRDGWYEVGVRAQSTDKPTTLTETGRWVRKGETLGFTSDQPDRTFALIRDEMVRLPSTERPMKYLWYSSEIRQTQFGREMQKAGKVSLQVMGIAAVSALYAGALWLEATSEYHDHDSSCDRPQWLNQHCERERAREKHRKPHGERPDKIKT